MSFAPRESLRVRCLLALALPALISLSCGPSAPDSLTPALSREDLRTHLRYLASDKLEGRRAGQRGHRKAAEYAAAVFEDVGLAPVFQDPSGRPAWTREVPLVRLERGNGNRITIRTPHGDTTYLPGPDGPVLLYPGQQPPPASSTQPIFIGYGIHEPEAGWDDFEGLDVRGRVVALLHGVPFDALGFPELPDSIMDRYRGHQAIHPAKLRLLEEHGAAGVLILPGNELLYSWNYLRYREKWFDLLPAAEGALSIYDPPFPVAVLPLDAARSLFDVSGFDPLEREGTLPRGPLEGIELEWKVDVQRSTVTSPNVAGMVRGSDPRVAGQWVVVHAHLDHVGMRGGVVFNGANDNASGSACLLEAAGDLADAPGRRSVLFLLTTAEEEGFWGARWFVEHSPIPLDSVIADLNLDEAGRREDPSPLEAIGPYAFEAPLLMTSRGMGMTDPVFRVAGRTTPIYLRSDHAAFVEAGVPALFLWTGDFPEYHSPLDDEELIDYDDLLRSALILTGLTRELADGDGFELRTSP